MARLTARSSCELTYIYIPIVEEEVDGDDESRGRFVIQLR